LFLFICLSFPSSINGSVQISIGMTWLRQVFWSILKNADSLLRRSSRCGDGWRRCYQNGHFLGWHLWCLVVGTHQFGGKSSRCEHGKRKWNLGEHFLGLHLWCLVVGIRQSGWIGHPSHWVVLGWKKYRDKSSHYGHVMRKLNLDERFLGWHLWYLVEDIPKGRSNRYGRD